MLLKPSSSITSCGNEFKYVKAIVAQNVTSDVKDLSSMFKGCLSLRTVSGLETGDTRNVKTVEDMFAGCENLERINGIEKIRTDNLENKSNVFGTYSIYIKKGNVDYDDRYIIDGFKVTCRTTFKCLKITDEEKLFVIQKNLSSNKKNYKVKNDKPKVDDETYSNLMFIINNTDDKNLIGEAIEQFDMDVKL